MTITLHVLLRRQQPHEPAPGTFHAWVVQEGVKGACLCKGAKTVDGAKEKAVKAISKDAPEYEIVWDVEDYKSTGAL